MGAGTLGSVAGLAVHRRAEQEDSSVAVGLITAAVSFAALARGAFFDHDKTLLLGLVALPAVVVFRPWRRPRVAAPQVSALLLGASAVVSGVVNGRTRAGAATAMVLLAAAVTVEAARRLSVEARGQLADALVWLGVGIGLFGWWAVAVRWAPYALPDQGLWRAATTLTYANAAAAFLVPLFLVAVVRPIGLLAPYSLLVGVGATQSRGGAVALAAGTAVVLVLSPDRGPVFQRAAAAGAGAALAVTVLLPLSPADTAPNAAVAMVGLVAGALLAKAVSVLPVRALVVMALVGAALTVAAVATVPAVRGARASLSSQDRLDEAVAAVRVFQRQPLLGAGAGVVFSYEAGDGRGSMTALFAHNEYLQLLAEQGLLGGLALLAGAAATGRALSRARRRRDLAPLWAGSVAALAAFAVHSGLDFIWHIPALPLLAAALLGLALPGGKESA